MAPRVQIKFDGVSSGAKRAAAETRQSIKGVGDQADRESKRISLIGPALRKSMQLVSVGIGALGVAAAVGLKKSVDAASNLTEQINKTKVVFAGAEKDVLAWSETTTKAIGISQRAALEYAGTFGNMLVPMGFARKEAASMSMQLVQLAGDMASFNNASPEETLEALRAGLAGETEPLRRFGVFLNEGRIQQEALNAGLKKGKEDLTAAGKAASIFRVILKDTSDQQGDAARTIGEHAGQQRVLRAVIEDTAAKIGMVFKPAVTAAMNAVNQWLGDERNQKMLELLAATLRDKVAVALQAIAKFVREHRDGIVDFFRDTAGFAGDAATAIEDVAGAADKVTKAVGGWDQVFKFGAILLGLRKLQGVRGGGGAGGSGLLGVSAAAAALGGRISFLKSLGPVIGLTILIKAVTEGDVGALEAALGGAAIGSKFGLPGAAAGAVIAPVVLAGSKDLGKSGKQQQRASLRAQIDTLFAAGQITAVKRNALYKQYGLGNPPTVAVGDPASDKAGLAGKGAKLSAKFGGLQAGTTALAGFVQNSGGTITAGREGGHSPTGGHGVGQSLDISWANNGPGIWAALFPHRAKFRLLLGPPGLFMWGQQYQNERDRKNHQDHIHVQYQGGPAELRKLLGDKAPEVTGGSPLPGTDFNPADTGADTSVTDTGAGAGAKASIDPRDLQAARGTARFINRHLDSIASPDIRARLRQRAAAAVTALAEVTDPKEFARIRRNLNALDRDFKKGVELTTATRQAQATARNIGAALGRMPEALQRELQPKLEALNRSLGRVTSQSQVTKIKADLEKIRDAIAAALARMQETVDRRRDAFGAAFGRLADKALTVFDAKTEKLIRAAEAKTQDLDVRLDAETPEERALREFREGRDAGERQGKRAELAASVALLARSPEVEAEEDRTRRLADLADVRAQIRQMELEDEERTLAAAAEASRQALADEVAVERQARETASTAARAAIEDERTLLRERFTSRLGEIELAWQNEEISADEAQRRMIALLADPAYQTDFSEAGALLGSYFAQGFQDALSGVASAVNELRAAVNELRAATGKTPVAGAATVTGPEAAWERALRLRSEALNRRYASRIGGVGGVQMLAMAHGGRVPGRYLGREDTVVSRVTPGEEIVDRSTSAALRAFLASPSTGGGRSIVVEQSFKGANFYGALDRETAQRWAAPLEAAIARIISYPVDR